MSTFGKRQDWIWRGMERIKWVDGMNSDEILKGIKKGTLLETLKRERTNRVDKLLEEKEY